MGYLRDLELARVNDYHLYHTLPAVTAYRVLQSNSLKLPLAETNSSEAKFSSKMFYLSFARTPSSGYIADRASGMRAINQNVLLVFDKKKLLAHRGVTTKPVDYWGADGTGRVIGGGAKEAEDRLFSDEPIIKNIAKDIVEIRIAVGFDKYDNNDWILELLSAAKKLKIITKLFKSDDKTGFVSGKEKKEVRDEIFKYLKDIGFKNHKNDGYSTATRSATLRKKVKGWDSNNWLLRLGEFVYKDKYPDLTKETRSRLWYHLRAEKEFQDAYAPDIHNLRSGHDLDKKKFYALLKATKAKTVKEFFKKLFDKWTAIKSEYDKEG